jgi:hypothetical protein
MPLLLPQVLQGYASYGEIQERRIDAAAMPTDAELLHAVGRSSAALPDFSVVLWRLVV